jgi:hypothetical protein
MSLPLLSSSSTTPKVADRGENNDEQISQIQIIRIFYEALSSDLGELGEEESRVKSVDFLKTSLSSSIGPMFPELSYEWAQEFDG